jgi:hypothetical protein
MRVEKKQQHSKEQVLNVHLQPCPPDITFHTTYMQPKSKISIVPAEGFFSWTAPLGLMV